MKNDASCIYVNDVEAFVIEQLLNPYYNSVWRRLKEDSHYYPFIMAEEYPGQDLEVRNQKMWFKHLQYLLKEDPTRITSWLEQFPEWKEKVAGRLKRFGPIKVYKWLQCPIFEYLESALNVEVKR